MFRPNFERLERKGNTKRLLKLLGRPLKSTRDLETCSKAAQALAALGDMSAILPMQERLKEIKVRAAVDEILPLRVLVSGGDLSGIFQRSMWIVCEREVTDALWRLENRDALDEPEDNTMFDRFDSDDEVVSDVEMDDETDQLDEDEFEEDNEFDDEDEFGEDDDLGDDDMPAEYKPSDDADEGLK